MTDRKSFDLKSLDEFQPREKGRGRLDQAEVEQASNWKSREPREIGQLGIRGDKRVVDRFKEMCEANGRRTYIEMIEILMNEREGR